jgi:hypothetical protein
MRTALAVLGAVAAACTGPRSTSGAGAGTTADSSSPTAATGSDAAPSGARSVDASGEGSADAAEATVPSVIHVRRAKAPITPTGHFRIGVWEGAPSTGTLLDRDRKGAVPVSEARFLWSERALYVFFYAGDLDLQARATRHDGAIWKDDSVELAFGDASGARYVVGVSVTGVVTDGTCPGDALDLSDPRCDLRWESGARAATDYDGKLNDISDRDEEWAVEASLPLAPLGIAVAEGASIPVRVRRCEIAHDGPRACGAWEGTLRLDGDRARP